jgi:hypothetical protein
VWRFKAALGKDRDEDGTYTDLEKHESGKNQAISVP